jgi:NAD(P)-dependent dehydrogenase (short-subunit alcohol dehydrogenase family)
VVNTVSDAMFLGLVDPVYGAAKAAIATLTQVGSVDCAQYGIRMNAIAPNRAGTRMSKGSPIVSYADDPALPEAEDYKDESPLNPSNSSPIVAWLLSDRSLHVTGQVFRTLAGAVALGRGWTSGDFAWPDGGRMKYTFAEVERVINSKIFATTFERGRLEFAANDPRVEVHP